MYQLTDDEKTNKEIEDAYQRFKVLYYRVCSTHQNHPRVAVLAMLSMMIDHCQENPDQFDPAKAHNLCTIVHIVADKIVEHHAARSSPVQVTEKPAEPQQSEEAKAYEAIWGTVPPTKHFH